ncbi:MAG TPA: Crp/Fnr family transcriptional regulator [Xanthobacteraceae bacterium]|jgi:CRP-like cAMP-binding protein
MAIEDDIAFLERVPTLNLLSRPALRILAIGAQSRYVHGGETLFNAGDDAEGGYVVQEGRLNLMPDAADEEKTVVVGPCTLLGEVALFTESQRMVTATALEPSTVLLIPRPLFLKMLDSFPDSARKLRDAFASRLDQSTQEISDLRAVLDSYE